MFNIDQSKLSPDHYLVLEEEIKKTRIQQVLKALAEVEIVPLIYKGTALAYRDFNFAFERQRLDTDILIPEFQKNAAFAVFEKLGYRAILTSDTTYVSHQLAFVFMDEFNINHVFDVHWHVSNRQIFKNIFSYNELLARAELLPKLSPFAMAFSAADSLIMACIHPVMHHHDCEDAIWIQDIAILAGKLTEDDWDKILSLSVDKDITKILSRGLRLSEKYYPRSIPQHIFSRLELSQSDELSEMFLADNLTDQKIMLLDFKAMPDFKSKLGFFLATVFPNKNYMLRKYNWQDLPVKYLWPVLYLRRLLSALLKL